MEGDSSIDTQAACGWASAFPRFHSARVVEIRDALAHFLPTASSREVDAWSDAIPKLQREVGEALERTENARGYHAILEYELPFEQRRTDVLFLLSGAVVVIELKDKATASRADMDQAADYARDLRNYHRACHDAPVHAVVVPTRASGIIKTSPDGVVVAGPDALDGLVARWDRPGLAPAIGARSFLDSDAYQPLPSIVEAVRELFESGGKLRMIERARAATAPTLELLRTIAHDAARTKTRRLVLVSGVPGSGKTLVGLQLVHSRELDDLAVRREKGKPTAPAVFLSGNGPLVRVLRHQLNAASGVKGAGAAFVRPVNKYLERALRTARPPDEHVLVFDEAQRAWDAGKLAASLKKSVADGVRSEPEHFLEVASRIPEWSVVVALIGGGQEIFEGEEGGIEAWRAAIDATPDPTAWTVHVPPAYESAFARGAGGCAVHGALNLDVELRYHGARHLHDLVESLLGDGDPASCVPLAEALRADGYHFRITRDLAAARNHLRERYARDPLARFGIVASSRDKCLPDYGIKNSYLDMQLVKTGPWYVDAEDAPGRRSCRHLESCVTEFEAQGLELDATLVAWGSDWIQEDGAWTNHLFRPYKRGSGVRDPRRLRRNAYRVLLTRGRDATLVFVPPRPELDATWARLVAAGLEILDG